MLLLAGFEIDAGLDGDDVAGSQRVLGLRPQRRAFVYEQADPVAEPRSERAAELGRVDARARTGVDLLTARARPNLLQAARTT